MHLFASGTVAMPWSIACRDMVSKAPMPSMDRMVRSGVCSVAAVRACTTASVPARVERANWWGWQAWWIGVA